MPRGKKLSEEELDDLAIWKEKMEAKAIANGENAQQRSEGFREEVCSRKGIKFEPQRPSFQSVIQSVEASDEDHYQDQKGARIRGARRAKHPKKKSDLAETTGD